MNRLELTRFPKLDYACKEAVNTLCTNLTFMGKNKKTIMITSCQAHEGKSFLSLCVQRNLARLGYRTVLVDLDLRKSVVASRYDMKFMNEEKRGSVHYLAGKASLNDVLYETEVPGAYMIPVGQTVTNSLTLLHHGGMLKQMLDQLKSVFDFVIVDAPPVGLVIDAAEIAKSCEGTILVTKYNSVSRKELQDAKQQIEHSGCEILGVVLNEVEFDSLSSKKYYHKSYYSHYDSHYYKPSSSSKAAGKTAKQN